MRLFYALLAFSFHLWSLPSQAKAIVKKVATIGQSNVQFGVYDAEGDRRGDVLYFHGFGDRFENHASLFSEFNAAGLRVIGFDLPSHGGSSGSVIGGIDLHSFESLAEIAEVVLGRVRSQEDSSPLMFAGWSFGGLLATRILQVEGLREKFPSVSGLVLFAPAFAPQKCVGTICIITNETLTHDASLFDREIRPNAPLLHLPFGARIILNAALSWQPPLPADLQTLVLLADDEDKYIHTPLVVNWVGSHRSNYVSRISAYKCRGARHELDNELNEFSGDFVRRISTDFVERVAQGERWEEPQNFSIAFQKPCDSF